MSKPRSPLAEARKRALASYIIEAWGGELPLSPFYFDLLADKGLTRAEVNRAVDALVAAGEATLDTERGRVTVHLVQGGSE